MKITIEYDTEKDGLMEPQLASALGEMLENHSREPSLQEANIERLLAQRKVIVADASAAEVDKDPGVEEQIYDSTVSPKVDVDNITAFPGAAAPEYTLEQLRAKVTAVASKLGGTAPLLDWVEELTGARIVSDTDSTYYNAIGLWFDEVLAGGENE